MRFPTSQFLTNCRLHDQPAVRSTCGRLPELRIELFFTIWSYRQLTAVLLSHAEDQSVCTAVFYYLWWPLDSCEADAALL